MKLFPICIPSYKNREYAQKLFSKFNTLDDVYLFVYDFDYKESGYDKLKFPSNVKIIQINIEKDFKKYGVDRTDLSTKRCFMFDYMTSLGIDYYISIDDDIGDQLFIIDKNNSNIKVDLKTFLEKMQEKVEEKINKNREWCIISPDVHFQKSNKLKTQKYNEVEFKYAYAWEGSAMFINRKLLAENNVKHIPLTQSDNGLNIACLKKQLLPLILSNFHSVAFPMTEECSTLIEKCRKEIMYSFKYFSNDMSMNVSWLNKKDIYCMNKDYFAILNGITKMDSKYKKLYEFAKNEDINNFMTEARQLLSIKTINKTDNEEW